jgi:ABC-type lipoprotein export system ATPase subunit
MLTIQNLNFTYNGSQEPIFINFQANFIQGLNVIIGPSGRGKSTLLSLIMGLIKPNNGEIFFEVKQHAKIGYMAQECELIDQLTVFDNVHWKALLHFDQELAFTKTQNLLNLCGIDNLNITAEKLSGGQKKRVALARALINDPDILIADEITAHLDKKSAVKIVNLIRKIASTKIVIISTHDQELIDQSDHVIEL